MKNQIILLCLLGALLASCNSAKKVVYLQNMAVAKEYSFAPDRETMIQPNDLLGITVNCKKPELAIPFNTRSGAVSIDEHGGIVSLSGTPNGTQDAGYRVDKQGNILFPILGKVHVAGYRLTQIGDIIREKIIAGDYIKDPQVSVDLLNFKYTVLGAVGHNGTFNVDGDRITLLEAIANAGDVTSKARIDNVKVIREEDGKRMVLEHDLRNREIFDSPYYYLKPNDIVYVEPRYKKKDGEDKGLQYTSIILSIVTAICSFFWAIK